MSTRTEIPKDVFDGLMECYDGLPERIQYWLTTKVEAVEPPWKPSNTMVDYLISALDLERTVESHRQKAIDVLVDLHNNGIECFFVNVVGDPIFKADKDSLEAGEIRRG